MHMFDLLPHIPIEVQGLDSDVHHSTNFPGCKVEIEGSRYKQSFLLTSTPPIESPIESMLYTP